MSTTTPTPPAFAGQHAGKPLPFDARRLSGLSERLIALRTLWSGHHSQAPASAWPLLAMDMYEHSYQMDYGVAALKYIDAFFANLNWEAVNCRLENARALHATLEN